MRKLNISKKTLALTMAMVLAFGCGIGGTLAWLSASTETVTNTFTVGDININLTETWNTDSDGNGSLDVWTGKVVPGATEDKDPMITVVKGSEKCYVYALVENNIVLNGAVVATPNINTSVWKVVGTSGTKTLYRYYEVVDAADDAVPLSVFTEVTYSPNVEKGAEFTNPTIVISAYAHQSENLGAGGMTTIADVAAKSWAGIQ